MTTAKSILCFIISLCPFISVAAQSSRSFNDYIVESQQLDVRYGASTQQVLLLEKIIDSKEVGFWYRDGAPYIRIMERGEGYPVIDVLRRYGISYSPFSNYDTVNAQIDSLGLFSEVGAALFLQVIDGRAFILDSLMVPVTKEASIYGWLWYTPKSRHAPWQPLYVSYIINWRGKWINPLCDKNYDSIEKKLAFTQNIIDTYLNEKNDE